MKIDDLPRGGYALTVWAGKDQVASTYLDVSAIEKPAYRMSLTLDRHFALEGDAVSATVRTEFFDGMPVPGLEVAIENFGEPGTLRTDADGRATVRTTARWPDDSRAGTRAPYAYARPAGPEESQIESPRLNYVLFPSRVLIDAEATIVGENISISGTLSALDLARAEREWATSAGTAWDAHGAAVARSSVGVAVTDHWYDAIKTGRRFDPITKRAYDTFDYKPRERALATTKVVSGTDGTFRLELPIVASGQVPPKGHDYEVLLTARDADGRVVTATRYAYLPETAREPVWPDAGSTELRLELGADLWEETYAVDDEVRLPLTWGGGVPPTGGGNRFLFYSGNRGLRDASVGTSPEFVRRFSLTDLPQITVRAVWFTGQTYVRSEDYVAQYDPEDRGLVVELTPDRARYEPGNQVSLRVRTTDKAGAPVSASVVVRAIDEKLYAIDASHSIDVLRGLYGWVDDGLRGSYGSHPVPRTTLRRYGGCDGGGCDTMGGDGDGGALRDDFRDVVLFRHVRTGANGRASVRFTLSDDLTSWRLSAAAVSPDLKAGQAVTALAVGLPLFIEAPVAAEYVAFDRPVIRVRAYGTALRAGREVIFTASAPSLGMTSTVVHGTAFTGIGIQLPALTVGDHRVRITATAGSGSQARSDTLVRTIHVVASRFTETRSAYSILSEGVAKPDAVGSTTYVFMDAGRGKYLSAIRDLSWTWGDRIDQRLAATIASDLLGSEFGLEGEAATRPQLSLGEYLKEPSEAVSGGRGLALLPYGSADLGLSVRLALLAPDRLDDYESVSEYFSQIRSAVTTTREEKNLALAGLVGLGGTSVADVRASLSAPDLTVRERLYLALAAATLGDFETARPIEQDVLARFGQRLGPWVRLTVSSAPADVNEATSLLALIALKLGDPIATAAETYVEENPTTEDLYVLQQVVFIQEALDRLPAVEAKFEYRVGDTRRVVTLDRGGTYRLTLAPSQVDVFSARTLTGSVAVDVSWAAFTTPAESAVDPSLGLDRRIFPSSPVPAGSVVSVILTPRFGGLTISGCYRVEDLAPSGLVPVWSTPGGVVRGEYDPEPTEISGQRVVFCASPSTPQGQLIYYARVVTPGDYVWEPATMRAVRAPESGALTSTERVVLR